MKLSELDDQAIDYIYDNLSTERLTQWEREFIESTMEQWERLRKLSDKQKEVLGRIWDTQP